MNEKIRELAEQADKLASAENKYYGLLEYSEKFSDLIIRECMSQIEQTKNSPFVSLDDAKRMGHFVDVTTKKIVKHFGVEE